MNLSEEELQMLEDIFEDYEAVNGLIQFDDGYEKLKTKLLNNDDD